MDEKTMVTDTLAGINGELVRYANMIPQTENTDLKQTLTQFRNACEKSQEEIFQIARERSYHVPAPPASKKDVEHLRSLFESGVM